MTLIPQLDIDTVTNPAKAAHTPPPNEVALRQAAAQFEALLLTQLTASLNSKDEDEEEGGLFSNSGGGMGLAKQMYSEQLAKTMAASGGIGIAEMIVAQALKRTTQPEKTQGNHLAERALSAVSGLKNEAVGNSAGKAIRESSKAGNLSPDASASADASMSAGKATSRAASVAAVGSPVILNDSAAATGATRPRRVHAIEGNATVTRETSAVSAPRLNAASPRRNSSRHAAAYVAYQAPLRGEVHSRFGMRRDPINGHMRLHQGIDIPARRGTPIEAAAAGTVVFAGRNKGYGNMVMIEHADGRRTLYAHAQSLFVKAGDSVAAGQNIAAVGSTGHSTGPHLHFEVRENNNRAVNPLTALSNEIAFARR